MLTLEERMVWFERTKDRIKSMRIPVCKLAEVCHMSRMTLSGWYRGRSQPTGLGLYAINCALDSISLQAQYESLAKERAQKKSKKS